MTSECENCSKQTWEPGEVVAYSTENNNWQCPQCGVWNPGVFNSGYAQVADPINAPSHYKFGQYEVRPMLLEWVKSSGLSGEEACDWFSMQQYLFRYCKKGKPKRDLQKARKYLEWLEERYENTP